MGASMPTGDTRCRHGRLRHSGWSRIVDCLRHVLGTWLAGQVRATNLRQDGWQRVSHPVMVSSFMAGEPAKSTWPRTPGSWLPAGEGSSWPTPRPFKRCTAAGSSPRGNRSTGTRPGCPRTPTRSWPASSTPTGAARSTRCTTSCAGLRRSTRTVPRSCHGAWAITRFADADVALPDARVVNDPAVVDLAFNNGDGSFTA